MILSTYPKYPEPLSNQQTKPNRTKVPAVVGLNEEVPKKTSPQQLASHESHFGEDLTRSIKCGKGDKGDVFFYHKLTGIYQKLYTLDIQGHLLRRYLDP